MVAACDRHPFGKLPPADSARDTIAGWIASSAKPWRDAGDLSRPPSEEDCGCGKRNDRVPGKLMRYIEMAPGASTGGRKRRPNGAAVYDGFRNLNFHLMFFAPGQFAQV